MATLIKWNTANFTWNNNSFTWEDVVLVRRAAGEDWNTWKKEDKQKLVKLILKIHGNTITESKKIEIKQYKIDLQSKITHLITSDDYVYPINPIDIFSNDLDIVYNFNSIELHNYEDTIVFLKKIQKPVIGIIVEKERVVNILLKDSYIQSVNLRMAINIITVGPKTLESLVCFGQTLFKLKKCKKF